MIHLQLYHQVSAASLKKKKKKLLTVLRFRGHLLETIKKETVSFFGMWLNFDSLCLRIVKAVAKHGACDHSVVYKYNFNYNGTVEKKNIHGVP